MDKLYPTGYLDVAMTDLDWVISQAMENLDGIEFDTLVGTGLSGALVVPALALATSAKFVIVRKPQDGSHHSGPMIGTLGAQWLFVDDFTSTGETRCRVMETIANSLEVDRYGCWCNRHSTVYVGDYYYARGDGSYVPANYDVDGDGWCA